MARGAEAYLQMWERAEGVPPTRCQAARARATRRGIGSSACARPSGSLLRRAGQPRTALARVDVVREGRPHDRGAAPRAAA